MTFDPSQMNTNSLPGQIALIIFALASLAGTVKPLLSGANPKNMKKARMIKGIKQDLEIAHKEILHRTEESRILHEWQLVARQLIYIMRNSMASSGVEITEHMEKLMDALEQYETQFIIVDKEQKDE